MIEVNRILELTLFKKFQLLAGKEYLSNEVTTVVILEYESSKIEFSGYGNGYFVLASYFFAATEPDFVNNSLKLLIKRHVSGIAIKMSVDDKLPEDLIMLAEIEHVPLLVFHEEFMEDLIISINESMKTRAQYIIHEEKLSKLLKEDLDEDEVRKIALEINPDFKNQIISAYFISKDKSSNLKVHTVLDKIMYHSTSMGNKAPWTFIKKEHDIILVCSFEKNELKDYNFFAYIQNLMSDYGFSTENFIIGYDSKPLDLERIKESVIKAEIAAKTCQVINETSLSFKNAGVYKYLFSLLKSEIISKSLKERMTVLEEYDKVHDAQLIKTLTSFIKNNRDFNKTGIECFQHTNTIRYRIKKAMELLGSDQDTVDDEIAIMIRCYNLQEKK